jgi:RNA polymerase sigma-70 factor (ECF subfamily)
MKRETDSVLISLYQQGKEEALSEIIRRYEKELFSFIFFKVNDEDLANDIFQDTFIKVILTLKEGNYNEEGKFIVWTKRIAYNLIIDYFRAKTKNPKISESTFDNEDFSIFDLLREPSENIEDELVSLQINQDLLKLLNFLPENQKEVIKLRFFDGLSFKEIADHTESSINTTLGRVRYALINLRKIMEEKNIVLTR